MPRSWTSGVARTMAWLATSSPRRSSVANVGRSVLNCWYVPAALPVWLGKGAAFFSPPSIVLPRANTSATFAFATCVLNSVYGNVSGEAIRSWTVIRPNRIKYPTAHANGMNHRRLPDLFLGNPSVRQGRWPGCSEGLLGVLRGGVDGSAGFGSLIAILRRCRVLGSDRRRTDSAFLVLGSGFWVLRSGSWFSNAERRTRT